MSKQKKKQTRQTGTPQAKVTIVQQLKAAALSGKPVTVIALKHCIDEQGNTDAWAQEIIKKLNTYTEIDPEGDGVQIYSFASIPDNFTRVLSGERHPEAAIEMCNVKPVFVGDEMRLQIVE